MVARRWWLGGGRGCLGGEEKKEMWREGEGSNVEEGRRKGHARNFRFNLGKLTIRSFP